MYVLRSVMHVLKNVKNISSWIIVNFVHNHVECVLNNIVKCLNNQLLNYYVFPVQGQLPLLPLWNQDPIE
jgi:hypothetical protein